MCVCHKTKSKSYTSPRRISNLTRWFLLVRKSTISEHNNDDALMSITSLIRIFGLLILKTELNEQDSYDVSVGLL